MSIIKKIGEIKNNYQLNIIDLDRESILQKLHHQLAIKYNLNPIFINNLFDTIIKYAREIQKDQ
jgi:chorismate mutase